MTPLPRWTTAAALALMALVSPMVYGHQTPAPPSPAPSPSPSPAKAGPRPAAQPSRATPAPKTITEAIDRVLAQREEEQKAPCRAAVEKGVPCFPVSTVLYGPAFSVRESLSEIGRGGSSPSRPPTKDEMNPYRGGSAGTVAPLITFDPVCVGKSILKGLKGKNDVYYLYRVRDAHGERAVLQDHRMDAATFQGAVEFLGRFEGECEALAAYRREERKSTPADGPNKPVPSPR